MLRLRTNLIMHHQRLELAYARLVLAHQAEREQADRVALATVRRLLAAL